MLIYTSEYFLKHETGRHPERKERLIAVHRHLDETGLARRCRQDDFGPIALAELQRLHGAEYIDAVRAFAEQGGGWIESDTRVSRDSYEVALHAAGAVLAAVDTVYAGPDQRALCLVRPPGHHARPDHAMGFCLFNNIALGAQRALDRHGLERILVVDWDVHHGNGTQEMFYDSPAVSFFSIHRYPFYPGTGAADETGTGAGLGYTLNVPVAFGTPRADYHDQFRAALERAAERSRPQLVMISAGFDAHRRDPIGSLGLETEDFVQLTGHVIDVAEKHAAGRLVSVLEGGYDLEALPQCVAAHLGELLRGDEPST